MPKDPTGEPKTKRAIINFFIRNFAKLIKGEPNKHDPEKRKSLRTIGGALAAPILPPETLSGENVVGTNLPKVTKIIETMTPKLIGDFFDSFLDNFSLNISNANDLYDLFTNKEATPFSIDSILNASGKIDIDESYLSLDFPKELTLDVISNPNLTNEVWKKGRILYGDDDPEKFKPDEFKAHIDFLKKITDSSGEDTLEIAEKRFASGMRSLAEKVIAAPDEMFEGSKSWSLYHTKDILHRLGVDESDIIFSQLDTEISLSSGREKLRREKKEKEEELEEWGKDGERRKVAQQKRLEKMERNLRDLNPIQCTVFNRVIADNPESFGIILDESRDKT